VKLYCLLNMILIVTVLTIPVIIKVCFNALWKLVLDLSKI